MPKTRSGKKPEVRPVIEQRELIEKSVDPENSHAHDILDEKIRAWPRNPNNDPYKFAVEELATNLANTLGLDVLTAYNEFCSPSLEECFEEAAKQEARSKLNRPMIRL